MLSDTPIAYCQIVREVHRKYRNFGLGGCAEPWTANDLIRLQSAGDSATPEIFKEWRRQMLYILQFPPIAENWPTGIVNLLRAAHTDILRMYVPDLVERSTTVAIAWSSLLDNDAPYKPLPPESFLVLDEDTGLWVSEAEAMRYLPMVAYRGDRNPCLRFCKN